MLDMLPLEMHTQPRNIARFDLLTRQSAFAEHHSHLSDRDFDVVLDMMHAAGTGFGLPRIPYDPPVNALPRETGADGNRVSLATLGYSISYTPGRCRSIEFPETHVAGQIDLLSWLALKRTLRRYVAGHAFPAPMLRSPFGADRFRTFSQEPYFPDRVGFIGYPLQTATRWNSYQL